MLVVRLKRLISGGELPLFVPKVGSQRIARLVLIDINQLAMLRTNRMPNRQLVVCRGELAEQKGPRQEEDQTECSETPSVGHQRL